MPMGVFFFFCRGDCVWVVRLPSQQIKLNFDFDFFSFICVFIYLRVCGTAWLVAQVKAISVGKMTAGSQNRRGSLGGRNLRFWL